MSLSCIHSMYQNTFPTPFHSLKTQPSDCCIHLPNIIPIGDSLKWPPSLPHFSSKSARLGVFPPICKYDLWESTHGFTTLCHLMMPVVSYCLPYHLMCTSCDGNFTCRILALLICTSRNNCLVAAISLFLYPLNVPTHLFHSFPLSKHTTKRLLHSSARYNFYW